MDTRRPQGESSSCRSPGEHRQPGREALLQTRCAQHRSRPAVVEDGANAARRQRTARPAGRPRRPQRRRAWRRLPPSSGRPAQRPSGRSARRKAKGGGLGLVHIAKAGHSLRCVRPYAPGRCAGACSGKFAQTAREGCVARGRCRPRGHGDGRRCKLDIAHADAGLPYTARERMRRAYRPIWRTHGGESSPARFRCTKRPSAVRRAVSPTSGYCSSHPSRPDERGAAANARRGRRVGANPAQRAMYGRPRAALPALRRGWAVHPLLFR